MANKNSFSKLRTFRYSPRGMVLPFVLLFAGAGVYVLNQSHAATASYVNFYNASSVAVSAGVSPVTDFINFAGTQNVSQVAPGSQLSYVTGGKNSYNSICYYVRAVNPKGAGSVAQVEFAGLANSKTVNIPLSNDYQSVCVNSGHSTQKSYNVYNKSALDGPAILVYQAVTST